MKKDGLENIILTGRIERKDVHKESVSKWPNDFVDGNRHARMIVTLI